ncbi:MAG TPA: GNAT family N-acetyltransferase [Mycobacteriales bacterium]|nr:GNAT family N-acetyltransferase [Mycobacteriales bacterium]
MDVHVTNDSAQFDAAAASFLEADPVRNTVLLTILDTLRAGGGYDDDDPWFAWAHVEDVVVGAALRTPPYKVALSGMSADAADALGHRLASYDLPGAFGDLATVATFAAGANRQHAVNMHEIQHMLTEVKPPPSVPGAARPYAGTDADVYVRWDADFAAEAGVTRSANPLGSLHTRVSSGGGLWLWDVDDLPVAMCGRSAPVCGVPRIGPVWTPPEHRRRGYAAALTAFVCSEALAEGARACTLFADAANPTSNGVYLRIGFVPAGETVEAIFTSTA